MEHRLFKPQSLEEGKHAVVGDCNGYSMEDRYRLETPLFAKAILRQKDLVYKILDYGCGVGRLAKEIINQKSFDVTLEVYGVDASRDMLRLAEANVDSPRFHVKTPPDLGDEKFDIAYCVYVLQHVPAVEIRDILYRIHSHLNNDGVFIYCSSDYRMAINYGQPGFYDDRHLGVNLQEELGRLFEKVGELFTAEEFAAHEVLRKMIRGEGGGLPHPAFVFKKKVQDQPLWDYQDLEVSVPETPHHVKKAMSLNSQNSHKVILVNRLSPGDILVMTNAVRDFKKAHPDWEIAVDTPCPEIFNNNPYLTPIERNPEELRQIIDGFSAMSHRGEDPRDHIAQLSNGVIVVDMHYPLINTSGACGWHFGYGHRAWLEEVLGLKIPQTSLYPEIYLDQSEKNWLAPVPLKTGYHCPYWVINAGSKGDFTLKQYPYYQEVIDLLKHEINFVQIGREEHNHPALEGAIDMRGQTNIRELFRVIYHAQGVITCVSFPMHIAAAFKKPCVVVAGAREGTRWELYPDHQFLYVNGCLPCAKGDGCWKSKLEDCNNKDKGVPLCLAMISPDEIANSVLRYYAGGILEKEQYAGQIV